jgi:PKHD-type hydroxylase
MLLKNYYYYFKSALSPRLVKHILDYGKSFNTEMAYTGGAEKEIQKNGKLSKKTLKNIQKKRKSDVVWLSENWIYKELHPFVEEANFKAGWNFGWDWSEPCQFTRYDKGQYYGWHCDSFEDAFDRPGKPEHQKIRKLSMTVSLSDPSEYTGGNLEFDLRNTHDLEWKKGKTIRQCTEIRPIGSVVVFPSFVWHRVAPVTKGTRYSLVMWSCGYPFK